MTFLKQLRNILYSCSDHSLYIDSIITYSIAVSFLMCLRLSYIVYIDCVNTVIEDT